MALRNPYAGGTCFFFRMATAAFAVSVWVTPGGRSPFRGRSSKVMAAFCAGHMPHSARKITRGKNTSLRRKFVMLESLLHGDMQGIQEALNIYSTSSTKFFIAILSGVLSL